MTPNKPETLGDYLRQARLKRGLSVREAARQAGVNYSTLSKIETGDVNQPDHDKLERLAALYKVSLDRLYALAGYLRPTALPDFQPYLRAKYSQLPAEERAKLEAYFQRLVKRYGIGEGNDEEGGHHGKPRRR